MAAVDSNVEKLRDAVPKLNEMSGEAEIQTPTDEDTLAPVWCFLMVVAVVGSGEAEQIQTPTDEDVVPPYDTLAPPPEAVRRVDVRQPRGHNKLPLTQNELVAFVVKASELSVNGMLALNGANAAALHMWIFRKNALGDRSKSVCEYSGWKTCISLVPFAMYLLTAWVTSMAKAIEEEPIGLSVISGFVLAFFVWPVILGGLMTHCMTDAAIWMIFLVATTLILIILGIWGTSFSHPKILRRCFSWCNCCGRDHVAAAQHADRASAAKALEMSVNMTC